MTDIAERKPGGERREPGGADPDLSEERRIGTQRRLSERYGRLARLQRIGQLHWSTWRGVLIRSVRGFLDDNCADWAAALTYYGVLALFPGAILVVALVSVLVDSGEAIGTLMGIIRELLPDSVTASVQRPLERVLTNNASARALLSFGAVGAVWSASGYIGAFTRASNAIYGVREGRRWYVLRPLQLLLTVVSLVLLAALGFGLVASGPVAQTLGRWLRLGDATVAAWNVAKWPLLVVIFAMLLSLLFWIAPNVQQPRLRWLTVGGAVALFAWLVVSLGFGLYVANFGSYDVTYGSLGAVVAFLVWLYLSNCAVMLGVEINAELARGRALQAGAAAAAEDPVLPPRTPA
jgi:membrane protein